MRAGHALAELVRAEARAAVRLNGESSSLTWNWPIGLIAAEIGHVESQDAGMRAPAPRLLLARALRLVLLVDRKRDAAAPMRSCTGITVCVGSGNSG